MPLLTTPAAGSATPPTPTTSLVVPNAAAAKMAEPQPPSTNRKVPMNSAPTRLPM